MSKTLADGPSERRQQKKKQTEAAERRVRAVTALLERVEKKFSAHDGKTSLGDYIRLIQLQKELAQEEPTEILVTWVEATEGDPEE